MKKIIFIVVLFVINSLVAQQKNTVQEWQEDLRYMQQTINDNYAFLFVKTTKELFNTEVEKLHKAIPNLQQHEIIVGISKLLALFEYGHTNLSYNQQSFQFAQFPFNLYEFNDGIYIQGTKTNYAKALGGRVLAVEGKPIAEVLEAIKPTVEMENEQFFKAYGINNIRYPEILHTQKITASLQDEITITLEKEGEIFNQSFAVMPKGNRVPTHRGFVAQSNNWLDARDQRATPLYLQNLDKIYSATYLEKDNTMYVRHSRIKDEEGERTKDFYARVFRDIATKNIDKLIIDLRLNGGGNNYLNKDVIKSIVKADKINKVGKLFVIIGKRTYSACQNLVNEIDNYTNAIFVGEPTAENVNFWGDNRPVVLPNTGITLSLSYLWWQDKPALENAPWTAPSIPVAMSFNEYASNQDPVLKAALSFKEKDFKPKPQEYIVSLFLSGQHEKLAEELPKMLQDPLYTFYDFETGLCGLGNILLQSGRTPQIQAAIQIYTMVLQMFPNSALAYQSLGEAYLKVGNRPLAKKMLHQVCTIDGNGEFGTTAKELLESLRN